VARTSSTLRAPQDAVVDAENAEAALRRPHIPVTEATGGVIKAYHPARLAPPSLEGTKPVRRSASLRRAVLECAFRGELVPQDPSDEPAEALLVRIRAERDAAATPTRRRPARK